MPGVSACIEALESAGVPCSKVCAIDEVLEDPQLHARNMLIEQDHPVLGTIAMPNLPFRFSGCDTTPDRVAPLLGQHNRKIARELGFDDASIDAMEADAVLYCEPAAQSQT